MVNSLVYNSVEIITAVKSFISCYVPSGAQKLLQKIIIIEANGWMLLNTSFKMKMKKAFVI